jgi:hypothetical protein
VFKDIDFKNLDDKQRESISRHLLQLKADMFDRVDFDYRRWQMDMALKQEYMDAAYSKGTYTTYNLDTTTIQELTGFENNPDFEADAYSDLYLPLLLKFYRAYLVNMANICFPANGDWLSITRQFSEFFFKTGIEDFLPFVNDAWVDIIKTENQRFSLKEKYKIAMAELIAYGNTCVGHTYNSQSHYIEPFVPGIGCSGIYPVNSDWRRSNLGFYYDVNYAELLNRSDFDQDIVQKIEPQTARVDTGLQQGRGSTSNKQLAENLVPYGKVRLYDFFLPSVYIKDGEEVYISKNVYITAAIGAQGDELTEEVNILKATTDINPVEHGLLFAAFGTALPGVFYQQGPLQPFLPHQYTANQFFSEISRSVGMVTDPPKTIIAAPGSLIDITETPLPPFRSGSVFPNMQVTSLVDATSVSNSLNTFLSYMNFFDRSVEEGTGISKGQTGVMNQGRKSATEIKEAYSGAQLNVVEAAGRYDEQVARPSNVCRISATQLILEEQVRAAVVSELEMSAAADENAIYEQVLLTNPLFQRLLNYSGIEYSYRNFYKKKMADYLDDQNILQEVESLGKQIMSLIDFADSPLLPPPSIPQIEDPTTGRAVPTTEEISQIQQQFIQEQQMKKEEARQQAKSLELDLQRKKLTFKDSLQPPEPTRKLFYEMLIAPISDSDVIVTGAMTTTSKELARENLLMLLQSLPSFPQDTLQKVDYDAVLMLLARANDVPMRDLLKDQSEIMREEELAAQQAQYNQQLQMQMAQNPGAQIPVIPQ